MQNSTFPTVNPSTGKKWKNAELVEQCHALTAQVYEIKNRQELKDWSAILSAAKSKTESGFRVHEKETKLAWRDLKSVYSTLSFQIDHAKKFLKSVELPQFN